MDTDQVAWLQRQLGQVRVDFDETVNEPPTYTVDAAAFGNTPAAAECHGAWEGLLQKVLTAIGDLRSVLDSDVRRLGDIIEDFRQTDAAEADRMNAAGARLTVISSHAQHDQDDWGFLGGVLNDVLRADQLHTLVDYAADAPGPVVVGSDDNVSLVDGEREGVHAPEALERYEDEGFENVGEVGGTLNGESIDHIWASGLDAGTPEAVDGGPSDHDGHANSYDRPWF